MPAPARARRKAQVRETLLKTATVLFRAHGYEATTMDQIAAAAQVSRRTVFRYFPTKDGLVFPHAERRVGLFREQLQARAGESVRDTIRRACLAVADEFTAHREELVLQQELIASAPALQARERELDRNWELALQDVLLRGRRRTARAERRATLLAGALMGGLRAVVRTWYAQDEALDVETAIDEVLGWLSGALQEV